MVMLYDVCPRCFPTVSTAEPRLLFSSLAICHSATLDSDHRPSLAQLLIRQLSTEPNSTPCKFLQVELTSAVEATGQHLQRRSEPLLPLHCPIPVNISDPALRRGRSISLNPEYADTEESLLTHSLSLHLGLLTSVNRRVKAAHTFAAHQGS